MNLQNLLQIFSDQGCQKVYVKILSPNDNSKNQVYFGGSFEILNILPLSEIQAEEAGNWSRERFKMSLNFGWIDNDGNIYRAPNSQLILYPKYPEVRFSGFLSGCENPPSELMTQRIADRLLFLGVTKNGTTIGYVASPDSLVANEYHLHGIEQETGIFKVLELREAVDNKAKLLAELARIHKLDWIISKSLTKDGLVSCNAPQCGGYTLEAELGIIRNGFSEPDFFGWEIKNFGVKNLTKLNSSVVTLFTPEPTGGLYKTEGVEAFLRSYGYPDKSGRPDRINFGGIHKIGIRHPLTHLEMRLIGFDKESGKIRDTTGRIALVASNNIEAASWSFSSMLLHWNRKHNQACYVPSLSDTTGKRKYKFGNKVIMGTGTDFHLFLNQVALGKIYYDPGIKMENTSSRPKIKRRSQFRIKSRNLKELYKRGEDVDINPYK